MKSRISMSCSKVSGRRVAFGGAKAPASQVTELPPVDALGSAGWRAKNRRITEDNRMAKHRIYTTSVASVYPHYLAKAEKKGRTKQT
jgi:hypothetical protein